LVWLPGVISDRGDAERGGDPDSWPAAAGVRQFHAWRTGHNHNGDEDSW